MIIPDALSQDTMDKDLRLWARCLETVSSVKVDSGRCLEVCRPECATSDGGELEGVRRHEGYDG
jgi:hypothetical protein